jgi:hypothetical protein
MKLHLLILQDHYRRWWWAHLLGFLLFGAIGVAVGFGLDPHKIPLGAGAFLGAVTLAVALNARTNARTLLSLPIRASELGTTFWWIAVPLSALAPAAGLAVGWTVSGLFGSTVPVGVAALLRFLLLTQSVSTFQFTVLCFMPNADTSDPREKILGGVTGAFWGIGLSASCSFTMFWSESRALWDPLSSGILAVGATCGLVSWHRRTAFLLQRARKREGPPQSVRSTVVLPMPSRLDGFAGLYLRMAGRGFAIGAFPAAMSLLFWLPDMGSMRIGFPWVVMGFSAGIPMIMEGLGSLRHWRTLPISAERMSWVMIRLLLTGCCAWLLSLIAMHQLVGQPLGWSNLGWMVLACGLLAVLFAFALRFGMNWFMLPWLVLFTPLMLHPLIPGRFFEQGGKQSATAAFVLTGVILLFVAQAWIVRSLRHQSRIFSPGFHQIRRLNAGS